MDNVLLMGGGMDSYAVAIYLSDLKIPFKPIHVDYGQVSAEAEILAIEDQLYYLFDDTVELTCIVDYNDLIKGLNPKGSLLFGDKEASPELKGRNLSLLMFALRYISTERGTVFMGLDKPMRYAKPFKDCTLEYFNAALNFIDRSTIQVIAPFISKDKCDVVAYGYTRDLKFLDRTMSCWNPKVKERIITECGECKHCLNKATLRAQYKDTV